MRITEYKQSNTSPLKYHIILNPQELKGLLAKDFETVAETIKQIRETKIEQRYTEQTDCQHSKDLLVQRCNRKL